MCNSDLKFRQSQAPRYRSLGNTLMEYGVVGMLVIVVVIGVLMGVGGNMNQWFAGLKQDMRNTADAASKRTQVIAQGKQAAALAQAAKQASASNTVSSAVALSLPVTSAAAPQTVGARGTDALAQGIRQLADKYLATGSLSPADHDLVMKVANKGHDIAMLQGFLEAARQDSNGDAQAYSSYRFNFNGQAYTPDALTAILGTTITEFQSLKGQAQASFNVKSSLELLGALEISGGQILINGGEVMDKNRSAEHAAYVGNMEMNDSNYVKDAANTHQNSATICTTGTHQDSGTSCTP